MDKRRDDLFIELRRARRKNYAARAAGRCLMLSGRKFNKYCRGGGGGKTRRTDRYIYGYMERGTASIDLKTFDNPT